MRSSGILPSCALLASLALGACALMPASGPDSGSVRVGQQDPESIPYSFVKVTPEITKVLVQTVPRLSGFKGRRRPGGIRFGIGEIGRASCRERV